MNPLSWILLAAVLALAALAARHAWRHKGQCGGGCAGCPHAGKCRHDKNKPRS